MLLRHFSSALVVVLPSIARAQGAPPGQTADVAWAPLDSAFVAYVDHPTAANAYAIRVLLPRARATFDGSAAQERATSRTMYALLPVLERQVKARDSSAVGLAFGLAVVTDGETAEWLDIMLGAIIRTDPRLFLSQLKAREDHIGGPALNASLVGNLGPGFVDNNAASCRELRSRVASLRQVQDSSLTEVKARAADIVGRDIARRCH